MAQFCTILVVPHDEPDRFGTRPNLQLVQPPVTFHRTSSALTGDLQAAMDAYEPGMSYRDLGQKMGVNKDTAGKRIQELKRRKLI